MLHANDSTIEIATHVWMEIVGKRHMFYTKNLKSFVGYARKQAAKYGMKGSRLDAAKAFIDICTEHWGKTKDQRMGDIWHLLPSGEHCKHLDVSPNGINQYQICGKIIQSSMGVGYAIDIIQKFYDNYGARARLASENKGVDWKAMSHAVRAAYQVKQLLTEGTITFPLEQAQALKNIKQGKHQFEFVIDVLEELMEEVEVLTKESTLPEKPDREYWEDFIYRKVCHWVEEVDFYLTNEKECLEYSEEEV
jgi:hypothetical protein